MDGQTLGKWRIASLLTGLVALSAPVPASGAVTLGETFTPGTCIGPITFLQSASPQSSYAVPSSGVLTSWSYQASAAVSPIKFKLGNRVSGDSFQVDAESALVTPVADTLNTYPIRVTAAPGDVIGIYLEGVAGCARTTPGYQDHYVEGDVLPGPPQVFTLDEGSYQLDVSAQLEPDADADGYGDETQDECPAEASTQADCDPPETEITKGAPNKLDRHKFKFKFSSSEADSTFECKLDRRPFEHCSSPRKVKRLDEGRHKFKVRAVDAAGNVDSSPARDRFKVVD